MTPLAQIKADVSRRLPSLIATASLLASLGLSACEEDAGPLPANRPPSTFLQIQASDVDTLSYRQILNWWGSDPDGEIVGYCISWDGAWTPPADAIVCGFDEDYYFTTATTDTFIVATKGVYAERTFRVRAVDDFGSADPIGKEQVFRLQNFEPELFWANDFERPTISLPAVSFAFTSRDEDGAETVAAYRLWLDGQEGGENARTVTDTLISIGVDDFDDRFGERTLFVQAIDEAQTVSNTIEHTWTVEGPPTESYLLIDNVGSTTPGEGTEDGYYRGIMDVVAPGDYFVYDVAERGNFRSSAEIYPLFDLFSGVLWYGGTRNTANDASILQNLQTAEKGLGEYLANGGNVLLAHESAAGDDAGLSLEFAKDILGIDGFYREIESNEHDIRIRSGNLVGTPFLTAGDSLELSSSTPEADILLLADDVTPVFTLAAAFLDTTEYAPPQVAPAAIGLYSDRLAGRLGLVTFLLSRAGRRDNGAEAGIGFVREVLQITP